MLVLTVLALFVAVYAPGPKQVQAPPRLLQDRARIPAPRTQTLEHLLVYLPSPWPTATPTRLEP